MVDRSREAAASSDVFERPEWWSEDEFRTLQALAAADARWGSLAMEPARWRVGPCALRLLTEAVHRGWQIELGEPVTLAHDGIQLMAHFTEVWEPGAAEWQGPGAHWARLYTTLGPFPDSPQTDRALADLGMHGPFEHVGMERDSGRCFLRIGFRIAQDLDGLFLDLENIPRALQSIGARLAHEHEAAHRPDWNETSPSREDEGSSVDDAPALVDLCRPFARGLLDKATALDGLTLSAQQRAALVTSMSVDIRKLCDLAVPAVLIPDVSERAATLAAGVGVDLRAETYQSQPKFDPGRAIFHYEHMKPVSAVVAEVREADDVQDVIGALQRGIRVAWITKDENAQLNALGYAKNRPDPAAAYREAGITLAPRSPER